LDDEAVVLSVATEQYYGLNETGKRVWELLAEHGDPEKVIIQMLAEFDVDEATLREEVDALIEELQKAQLARIER
jgi:23S rRNA maturation-related 3'-5' exoribonuclease YhaM